MASNVDFGFAAERRDHPDASFEPEHGHVHHLCARCSPHLPPLATLPSQSSAHTTLTAPFCNLMTASVTPFAWGEQGSTYLGSSCYQSRHLIPFIHYTLSYPSVAPADTTMKDEPGHVGLGYPSAAQLIPCSAANTCPSGPWRPITSLNAAGWPPVQQRDQTTLPQLPWFQTTSDTGVSSATGSQPLPFGLEC